MKRRKSVIIAGCGRLGSTLAGLISSKGMYVTIIDMDEDSFRKLPDSFSGYKLVHDATDVDVLEAAGITEAAIVIASTERDNVNNFIGQIASRIYGVPQVYVRLYDQKLEKLIEGFNIEAIYPARLEIDEFEKLSKMNFGEES